MTLATFVPEPCNQDWSSRWPVIGHNCFWNVSLLLSDFPVCLSHKQWQQYLKHVRFQWQVQGCEKIFGLVFFVQNYSPTKWLWCQIHQISAKVWWSAYIETAAEILLKDDYSKVAWPLKPCNVWLFFMRLRVTMKIAGFLMVVCYLYILWNEWARYYLPRMYIIPDHTVLQIYPDQVFSVLWRPQKWKKAQWPLNKIRSSRVCRTFIAQNDCH